MLRNLNTLALLTTATAWATLLVVGGGLLVTNSGAIGILNPRTAALVGLAALAAGIFIFEVIVADRLFPKAVGRLPLTVEVASGVLMLLLSGAALVDYLAFHTAAPG